MYFEVKRKFLGYIGTIDFDSERSFDFTLKVLKAINTKGYKSTDEGILFIKKFGEFVANFLHDGYYDLVERIILDEMEKSKLEFVIPYAVVDLSLESETVESFATRWVTNVNRYFIKEVK